MTHPLLVIIAKLERLTEPDASLHREIATAAYNLEWRPYRPRARKTWGYEPGKQSPRFYGDIPNYTHSVDAALTLIPEHHLWELRQGFEARAMVWMIEVDYDDRSPPTGYSTTFPALALSIAALKARAEKLRLGAAGTASVASTNTIATEAASHSHGEAP